MPGSLGLCRYPLAIATNRARISSPRSVEITHREPLASQRISLYFGLQARVTVQVVVLGDAAAVREDLGAFGVLLARDVAEFFEQRHIDVGLDVTGDSGVAIPVPGAADVGGLVDQPHVLDAELLAPRADEQSAEAGADDRDVDGIVRWGRAEFRIGPRIVAEPCECAGDLDVLGDAVGPQTPLAFFGVFGAQRIGVERILRCC